MVNTESNIADVNEANINGVRALDSKGLVDTVEEMQEQGLGSQQKDFTSQLQ
jgi:hypothetical protein